MKASRLVATALLGLITMAGSYMASNAMESLSNEEMQSVHGRDGLIMDFEIGSPFAMTDVTYTDGDGANGSGSAGQLRIDTLDIGGGWDAGNSTVINGINWTGLTLDVDASVDIDGTTQGGIVAHLPEDETVTAAGNNAFIESNSIGSVRMIDFKFKSGLHDRRNNNVEIGAHTDGTEGITLDVITQLQLGDLVWEDKDGDGTGNAGTMRLANTTIHGGYESIDLDGDGTIESPNENGNDESSVQVPATMDGITVDVDGSEGIVIGGPSTTFHAEATHQIEQSSTFSIDVNGLDVSNTDVFIRSN